MRVLCCIILSISCLALISCGTGGEVVSETIVSDPSEINGLGEQELAKIAEIKEAKAKETEEQSLSKVIKGTPNYTVEEYLRLIPDLKNVGSQDYRIGGDDILDIMVLEDQSLSRENIRVSREGFISFPYIGRLGVAGLTASEVENMITTKLTEHEYLLDPHVSVSVKEFKSKKYTVLGSVKEPGSYTFSGKERLLDAISSAGGTFESGKQAMIIRTLNPDSEKENKIVIRIDLDAVLKEGNQTANLLLADQDLLYIPKAESFYIIGQVKNPGSYPYIEKEITIVEAISKAGGFTDIAARNRTRIVRMENGMEKIIEIRVDAITETGKKGQDLLIQPGDVIVVPESYF